MDISMRYDIPSSSSHSYESSNSNAQFKYYGLKRPNYYKLFQQDIIHLTSYIVSIVPNFTIVHNVMSILRILQFLLPCLIPAYTNYWSQGSVDQITINTVSVLYSLIPPTLISSISHYIIITYLIIELIFLSIMLYLSSYFKKNAKLPKHIPSVVYFYQITFGYYLCPIVFYAIFDNISCMAAHNMPSNTTIAEFVTIDIISFICLYFNCLFIFIDLSLNLEYRPNSLASATPVPHFIIFIMTILINIFFGLGVKMKKNQQIVLFCFNFLFYIYAAFSVFYQGGYIQTYISNLVLASSITGAFFTLLNLILISINRRGSLVIFFSLIIFFVLILLLSYFLYQNITIRQLKLLDSIQADEASFSFVRSPNQFVFIAACGIKYAHPIIIDSSFFILGTQRWEKEQFVYFIYAKFIAIYPEETGTLKYVYKKIPMKKTNSLAVRCIEQQAKSIMKHRETEITPQLQSRLNQLNRQTQSTKHKLEHVWDIVILGNINEIDIAAKGALLSIDETKADIQRLLVEYPNNKNVTYFYSVFLNEVIGDHSLSQEYRERTRSLQRGVLSVNDQTHLYGLKMYPSLPNSIRTQNDPLITIDDNQSEGSSYYKELDKEKERQTNLDIIAGIKGNIEELKIPSIIGTKVIRILTTLITFVLPSIIGLILIKFYIIDIKRPLEFIGSLSLLRVYSYQIISFSMRYLGEVFSIFPKISTGNPPISLGNTWDTKSQLQHILTATTDSFRNFDKFRIFEKDNSYIKRAHYLVFQNTVQYTHYASPTNFSTSNITIQSAIIDLTIQLKTILSSDSLNPSILNSGIVLNLVNNEMAITNNIHRAIRLIFEFLTNSSNNFKKEVTLLFILLVIAVIVIYSTTMIIQLKWMNSNKRETYQCLFSLPKNVVSKLAENKKLNKKENQAEEVNKQSDNIIRTLNSYGTVDNSFSYVLLLILGTFLIVIFTIVSIILFLYLFLSLSRIIVTTAPFLHYLLASYSMLLSSLNWLNIILFDFGGYQIPTTDFNSSLDKIKTAFLWHNNYYHILLTGTEYTDEVPLKEFTEALNLISPDNCTIFNNKINLLGEMLLNASSEKVVNILNCMSIDMIHVLVEPLIMYSISSYQGNESYKIDPKKIEYTEFWRLLISPIYDRFYEPLHMKLYPSITDELDRKKGKIIAVIAILLVLTILIEFVLYIQILSIENHIRSVLKLLLHCNPNVIFSSTKITRILAGDFSGQQNDSLEHNSSFFETIFNNLPDAIMYANSDMIILNANAQCTRVFGDIKFIGKSITEFFMSEKFSGNVESLFSNVNSNPIEEIEYKLDSGSDIFLKVTSMMANGKFVMICQDVTQAHNYNTLILSEKQNSDKLLETILPPMLVGRVQQGEKNISLSVQSASILFSDIVSFTPWCGSLPAEKVMSTLNILFKRMDSILDTKETMTKIKCIGDCYMAAGGIFAELNQPAVHAKEVVSFGLLSIKEVQAMNKEIHENLRIRVGVNTGGPIVAGVLGIGKPTFEIIGPAINRAQQMEQNGVPMKVHISISVYELICGLNFKFSTRRTIQCKNEDVVTYLVEP